MTSILKVDTIQTTAGAAPNLSDIGFSTANTIIAAYYATSSSSAQTSTSTSHTNITGLSITMTPKLATSRIYIQGVIAGETYGTFADRGLRLGIYGGASGTTFLYDSQYEHYMSNDTTQRIGKSTIAYNESASSTAARTYNISFCATYTNDQSIARVNQYGAPSQMLVYEIGQ